MSNLCESQLLLRNKEKYQQGSCHYFNGSFVNIIKN